MRFSPVVLLTLLLAMPLFASETQEQTFWKWFTKNQEELFHFEKDREAIFDRLSQALAAVDKNLTFEFGPVGADGTREFVISAGGIKAAFPSVEALHAAAPKLPKWHFIKYRQRRSPLNDLEFAGRKVKADEVHYVLFPDDDPKKLSLMIFFDGYTEQEKEKVWGHIGYLFLDEALGEYDVETRLGVIEFSDRDSEYFKDARPLKELPAHFDRELER